MHKVSEGKINVISQPTMLFSHTNELEIPELVDAETDPPENLQDDGAHAAGQNRDFPAALTPEDTSVVSNKSLPCP